MSNAGAVGVMNFEEKIIQEIKRQIDIFCKPSPHPTFVITSEAR
jgi:hypothetical protein